MKNINVEMLPRLLAELVASEQWPDEQRSLRAQELLGWMEAVLKVSAPARKLLVLVAEQAPQEAQHEALMPRLHEACGLDPEEMDRHLNELRSAGLIRVDGEYPFEQVAVATTPSGWDAAASLIKIAREHKIEPRELFTEFDLSSCTAQ